MRNIYRILFLNVIFISNALPILATSPRQSTSSIPIKIILDRMYCKKTTELGADEVYIIVEGKRSDGAAYFQREPGTSIRWDMNDNSAIGDDKSSGDSYSITNKILFSGELEPGQFWDLNIIVYEEDGFNSIEYQSKASEMLATTGNPYAEAASVIDFGTR